MQLLLSISSPLGNPSRMQLTHLDSQGFLYLTYSGKASDDEDGKRVRQALRLTQLFTPKSSSVNITGRSRADFPM